MNAGTTLTGGDTVMVLAGAEYHQGQAEIMIDPEERDDRGTLAAA